MRKEVIIMNLSDLHRSILLWVRENCDNPVELKSAYDDFSKSRDIPLAEFEKTVVELSKLGLVDYEEYFNFSLIKGITGYGLFIAMQ